MKNLKELKFKIEYSDELFKIIGIDKKTQKIMFAVNFHTDKEEFNEIINKFYGGNRKQFFTEIIKTSHEMLNNK